jgi:biopolymer transport protein ExbD
VGCGDKKDEQAQAPLGPALGVLEIPIALRNGDPAPADAHKVEINMTELRVNDQVVVKLDNGKVPAAEVQDGVLPKVKAALASPSRARMSLAVHASLPYETAAQVIHTAVTAGLHQLAFQVRKPGGANELGWLDVNSVQTTPRSDDEVAITSVDPRKWDDFTAQWQAMYDACRGSKTGNCPFVPGAVAQGGNLKIVLYASGQGVNLNFQRVGLSPEQLAAEEKARQAKLAKEKEDAIQGRVKRTDVEKDLAEGDPATEASFQFRSREATDKESPLTDVMAPLCGPKACGAVVSADKNTLMIGVVSVIGASFADGSAAPSLAFELPWTQKPKVAAAAAAP